MKPFGGVQSHFAGLRPRRPIARQRPGFFRRAFASVSSFHRFEVSPRLEEKRVNRRPGTNPRCHCEFDHCHPLRSAIRCAHHPQSLLGNIRRDWLNTDRRATTGSGETIKSLRQSPVVHNFLDPNRHHLTTFCERVFQIGGSAFWHRSHSARFGQTSTTQTIDVCLSPQRESIGHSHVAVMLGTVTNPRNPSQPSGHAVGKPPG